jgi:hypothetical protein
MANLVTVPLSTAGALAITNSGSGPVYISATVEGWFTA